MFGVKQIRAFIKTLKELQHQRPLKPIKLELLLEKAVTGHKLDPIGRFTSRVDNGRFKI
jgi:hypothetical protein